MKAKDLIILTDKGVFLKQECMPGFRKWEFAEGEETKLQAYLRTEYAIRKYHGEVLDITDLVEFRSEILNTEYIEKLPDVYYKGKYVGSGGSMINVTCGGEKLYFKITHPKKEEPFVIENKESDFWELIGKSALASFLITILISFFTNFKLEALQYGSIYSAIFNTTLLISAWRRK